MIEGKRLGQPLADEIKRIIYAPRLASERTDCFAQLSAVNMAHLLMLAEARILEPAIASTIARAMLEIDTAGPDAMDWDPAREDAYYNHEARLVELAGMEADGQIHVGRSRNDIGATIDRMRVREWCLRLGQQLCLLQGAFLNRALQHTQTVMSGYTHLQPAQPITYGFYLLGIAEVLQRDGQRLRSAFENANKSPPGAGALAGTSFKIDRRRGGPARRTCPAWPALRRKNDEQFIQPRASPRNRGCYRSDERTNQNAGSPEYRRQCDCHA